MTHLIPLDKTEYVKGAESCALGNACPAGASKAFVQGYSDMYQLQEMETAKSEPQQAK